MDIHVIAVQLKKGQAAAVAVFLGSGKVTKPVESGTMEGASRSLIELIYSKLPANIIPVFTSKTEVPGVQGLKVAKKATPEMMTGLVRIVEEFCESESAGKVKGLPVTRVKYPPEWLVEYMGKGNLWCPTCKVFAKTHVIKEYDRLECCGMSTNDIYVKIANNLDPSIKQLKSRKRNT